MDVTNMDVTNTGDSFTGSEKWWSDIKKSMDEYYADAYTDGLVTGTLNLTVESAHDGTNTLITVVSNGDMVVAEGRARRMKGDTRDRQVGISLATMRAFQSLVDRERQFLASKGIEG